MVLRYTTKLPAWMLIIVSVFGTIIISRVFYNMENKKAKN